MASLPTFKISLLFLAFFVHVFGAPGQFYNQKYKENDKVPVDKDGEYLNQYTAHRKPSEKYEPSGDYVKFDAGGSKNMYDSETKPKDKPSYNKEDEKEGESGEHKNEYQEMKPDKDKGTGSNTNKGSGPNTDKGTGSNTDKGTISYTDKPTGSNTESNPNEGSKENLIPGEIDESIESMKDKEEEIYSYMEIVAGLYQALEEMLASANAKKEPNKPEEPKEKYDCSLQKTRDGEYRGALGKEDDFTIPPKCGIRKGKQFSYGKRNADLEKRIMGGEESQVGEWPWLVSISKDGHHFCGGSLISSEWILTAAHCFPEMVNPCDYRIRLGEHDLNSDKEKHLEVTPLKIISHPYFDGLQVSNNDIALIKLRQPVSLKANINSLCLPSLYDKFGMTDKCTVAGWGFQDDWTLPMHIRHVSVSVMSDRVCKKLYPIQFSEGMTCAGHIYGGKDACKGDSGGPMVCKRDGVFVLAGIVSAGDGCAKAFKPGLYTRTTDFMDWIESAIFKNQ